MFYSEHLNKADESIEIRHNNNGDVIHCYFKDGECILFPSLQALIDYQYLGINETERIYVSERQWSSICKSDLYSFYELPDKYERVK